MTTNIYQLEELARKMLGQADPNFVRGNEMVQAEYLHRRGCEYKLCFGGMRPVWVMEGTGGHCDTTEQAYQNQRVRDMVFLALGRKLHDH